MPFSGQGYSTGNGKIQKRTITRYIKSRPGLDKSCTRTWKRAGTTDIHIALLNFGPGPGLKMETILPGPAVNPDSELECFFLFFFFFFFYYYFFIS